MWSTDVNLIAGNENGDEEWKALNMVPMGMGHEHVNLIAGRPVFRNEVASSFSNAGSSIHDNPLSTGPYLYAGGVTAVPNCIGSWTRDGPTGAPKKYFHAYSDVVAGIMPDLVRDQTVSMSIAIVGDPGVAVHLVS